MTNPPDRSQYAAQAREHASASKAYLDAPTTTYIPGLDRDPSVVERQRREIEALKERLAVYEEDEGEPEGTARHSATVRVVPARVTQRVSGYRWTLEAEGDEQPRDLQAENERLRERVEELEREREGLILDALAAEALAQRARGEVVSIEEYSATLQP